MRISFQAPIIYRPQVRNNQNRINQMHSSQMSSDTVCFGNAKQDTDFLELSKKEIFKILYKTIMKSDNILGAGCEAEVYSIPNTKYCVKVFDSEEALHELSNYMVDIDTNITQRDKINHVVAKVGDNLAIMKRIEGTTVCDYNLSYEGNKRITSAIIKFPMESFNSLLKQIANAHKQNMSVDAHFSNIIVSLKDKTFTLIDFNENMLDFPPEPMFAMLKSFVHPFLDETQFFAIVNKILKAGLNEFKPEATPSFEIAEYDFVDVFDYVKLIRSSYNDSTSDNIDYHQLKNEFLDLMVLKTREINGADVTRELQGLVSKIEKDIDKYFPVNTSN